MVRNAGAGLFLVHNYPRNRKQDRSYGFMQRSLFAASAFGLLISSYCSTCSKSYALMLCPVLYEMSTLLNTGLDRETLAICVSLLESGVNPEALALVVKDLRSTKAAAEKMPERTGIGDHHNNVCSGCLTDTLSIH